MAELTRDETRYYHLSDVEEYPLAAGVVVYEGAAVGENGSGYARPLVAGDQFLGFASKRASNIAGIAGADRVPVKTNGLVKLLVSGITVAANKGADVYASNDGTFTVSAYGNSKVGKVHKVESDGYALVRIEVASKTSETQPLTWSTKPAAAAFGRGQAWFSDIGVMGYSDGVFWRVSSRPIRNTPVKIALFGDSTATTGTYTSNDNCEVIDLAFPGSGTTQSSVTSTRYMTFLNYPCIMLARNAGIGGQTTTDMLARDGLVASATRKAATDLANAGLDCIIFRGGSINNFSEGIYTQQDIEDRVELHKQVLSRLRAAGAAIIDEGIAGYLTAPGTTAQMGKLAAIQIFNAAIRDYIASLNDPRIVYMNPVGVTCDTSGIWLSGYSSDGVHPEISGQIAISEAEKVILTSLFGPSSNIRYPGSNLATNPMLAASAADGSGRGTVATGFSIAADNINRHFTDLSIDIIDGIPMQSFTYVPQGAGVSSATVLLPVVLSDLNITSGDVIGVEFDYWIRKVDGTALPVGSTVSTSCAIKKTSNGSIKNTAMSCTTYGGMTEIKGHIVFNKLKVNDDQANLESITFDTVYSPAAGVGTLVGQDVRISIGGVRVVKQ